MKKSLLITTSLLTLGVVTGIYAQSVGATGSIVDKMKAVAHSFTLGSTLNPTDTGLTSDPVKGKKTGDILTAGEYNRLLELVSEGGGGSGPELWKCTCGGYMNMVTTSNLTFGETCIFGNGGTANNVQYSSWSCTKIQNAGGSGGSAGGAEIIDGGIISTTATSTEKNLGSNWDLISLTGSYNSSDAAATGGYIYKLGGQKKNVYRRSNWY